MLKPVESGIERWARDMMRPDGAGSSSLWFTITVKWLADKWLAPSGSATLLIFSHRSFNAVNVIIDDGTDGLAFI